MFHYAFLQITIICDFAIVALFTFREARMDFNFKKIATEASGFFSRAKQYTEETFLKAERTDLDPHFENLLQRADKTEEHTRRLLSCIEGYLQPNPTMRMEDVFYEKLELKKDNTSRLNNLEHMAQAMSEAGEEFGSTTAYGSTLLKIAQSEQKLGQAEREFVAASASQTLLPIRRFLEGDMRTIQKERKVLNTKRLDLDACKSRLRKAKTVESQASTNSKTAGNLTLEQAEADLRIAQTEFDKQVEITKLLLEGIQTAHNNQLKCLRDFVDLQMSYFAQAHQTLADLQRELSGTLTFRGSSAVLVSSYADGIPAQICSSSATTTTTTKSVIDDVRSSGASDDCTKQARVILDYDAVLPQEMSVKQNDVLVVYRLPGLDPDYIMAEKGGIRGRIRTSDYIVHYDKKTSVVAVSTDIHEGRPGNIYCPSIHFII
ncbi:BAR domain protein [Dictyocaulus viviparus]|uniref:BAR domain protein n=1 Tax=Dictyocaulus viviparus TaxID=29172 RepID=A0A0D8XHU3_DICVI|nr:BAR domain protein [Dictyocaulus viviparus]